MALRPMCVMLLVLVALAGGMPPVLSAQEPIKIGFITVLSGRLAFYGHAAVQGLQLALDQINANGGINGRQLKAVVRDTKLQPQTGVEVARKVVLEDGVDVVMGIVSSAVAKAVAPQIGRMRTPLITTLTMTPDITGKQCNRYVFRINLNVPQNIKAASILAAETDVKKWTTVGPDYVFGYQCWQYFQDYLGRQKADVRFATDAEVVFVPVTEEDSVPYIRRMMNSGADGVLVSLYGGNLKDFIRQGNTLGIFHGDYTFLFNLAYSTDVVLGLGLEMPQDLWLGGLYWFQMNDSPVNREFVDAYRARYHVFPDHNAAGAYSGVLTYAAAVRKAGSTEAEKVVDALEGLTLDLPAGKVTIRAGDHQAIYDGLWGKTGSYQPKWRCRLLDPMRLFPARVISRPVRDTECTLGEE